MNQLLPNRRTVQCHHGCDNRIENHVFEFHYLCSCKGWHHVEEEQCCWFPLTYHHKIQSFVHLQPVAALPVSTFFQLLFRSINLLLCKLLVFEEKRYTNLGEDIVKPTANPNGLLKRNLVSLESSILVADAVEEISFRNEPISDLHVAKIFFCIGDFLFNLFELLFVLCLQLSAQGLVSSSQRSRAKVFLVVWQHAIGFNNAKDVFAEIFSVRAGFREKLRPFLSQRKDWEPLAL